MPYMVDHKHIAVKNRFNLTLNLVTEAISKTFFSSKPGAVFHHGLQFFFAELAALLISCHNTSLDRLEHFNKLTQLFSVGRLCQADHGVMNHHHSVNWHEDFFAGHSNDCRSTGRQTVNHYSGITGVRLYLAGNGVCSKNIAAVAVDTDADRLAFQLSQRISKAYRANIATAVIPRLFADDIAINTDFSSVFGCFVDNLPKWFIFHHRFHLLPQSLHSDEADN